MIDVPVIAGADKKTVAERQLDACQTPSGPASEPAAPTLMR